MKRFVCLLLTALLFACLTPVAALATLPSARFAGDVNCDGKINTLDLARLQSHLLDTNALTGQGLENANIDGFTGVALGDALQLKRYLMNAIHDFPDLNDHGAPGNPTLTGKTDVQMILQDGSCESGKTTSLKTKLKNNIESFAGITFLLRYDTSKLTVNDIYEADYSGSFTMTDHYANGQTDGKIVVFLSADGENLDPKDGPLFEVDVSASSAAAGDYPITVQIIEASRLVNDAQTRIAVAGSQGKISVAAANRRAAISNVMVNGITDFAIELQDATITLTNARFKELAAGTPVTAWFTNAPAGMTAKIKTDVAANATSATVTFSGAPTAQSGAVIAATIPAADLIDNASVAVTANQSAKWNIIAAQAPAIHTQPASRTVCVGNSASFFVTADGKPVPTYQWQVSTDGGAHWSDVTSGTGEKNAYYDTPAATKAMSGYTYRCVVSNGVGQGATSDSAVLRISAALQITAEPADPYIIVGQQATISATAAGDGLTYQWYINRNNGRGWQKIDHATGPRHVTSLADLDCDGYRYYCHIEDEHENTLDSRIATLHVQKASALPQTGDSATPGLWLAMLLPVGIGLFMLIRRRRKA